MYVGVRLILARGEVLPAPAGPPSGSPLGLPGSSSGHSSPAGPANGAAPIGATRGEGRARDGAAFRRGFLCDMTNPKTVIAFTSVIPQFLAPGAHVLMPTLLGVTFAALGFGSLLLYCALFSGTGRLLRRPRLQRGLLRGGGVALVGFGVALAVEDH